MFEFEVPEGDFAGYIFDCDGTLVDSMPAHFVAWTKALAEFGQTNIFPEDVFYGLGGVPTDEIVRRLNKTHGTDMDPLAVTHRKEILFDELVPAVVPIEGVVSFAREVATRRPVSVASGGFRGIVRRTLQLANLADLFPVVVTADDVKNGKPAPDCFLLAAQLMRVPAEQCLVFEDSWKGIEAADAAGMKSVMVRRMPAA